MGQPSFLPDLSPPSDTVSPLMAQYFSIKARHDDCLLFFRLGDFYELFYEDAVKASQCLDIALTRRGQHQGQDVPMCGVPAHAYETYLAKLIRSGHRVAVCEQQEKPEEAKKRGAKSIVARDVVRIVTPGTITEDSLLERRSSNYLLCASSIGDEIALAWCDITAGSLSTETVAVVDLSGALARLDASEILIAQRLVDNSALVDILAPWRSRLVTQSNGRFDSDNAQRRVQEFYDVGDISAFGEFTRAEISALGALLDYIVLTQKTDLKHFSRPQKTRGGHMSIDAATRRNLELVRTLSGERRGSLLDIIDLTETGAGARLLAAYLTSPLTDVDMIDARLNAVACCVDRSTMRDAVRQILRQTPDLERAVARLALGRGGPRDLAAVRDCLTQAQLLQQALALAGDLPQILSAQKEGLGDYGELMTHLEKALASDLPLLARDGNFVARGYSTDLDRLVSLRDDGRRVIVELQQKYINSCAVGALKIKHNQIIGYHIEVPPSQASKLLERPETFIHRQTLATAARFTTVELSDLDRQLSEAAEKVLSFELCIFEELVARTCARLSELRLTAQSLAVLDVTAALAELAVERRYTRPIVDMSLAFDILGGRHPVVEHALRARHSPHAFIPNDCDLAPSQFLWLLTGPNMAGKSTFLRQNALIALLAQLGSFVPARSAHIGIVDRLFSRVGAADDLAAGRSTFMVEMVETAAILNQSGERALVILDEIGRGTSTYDGLSIAWAVLEHLHDINRCRALFATHYHELTVLKERLSGLRCATMRIKEWDNRVIFLHEVIEGVADKSYGIHVAHMAGLPPSAVLRAQHVLEGLETARDGKVKIFSDLPSPDRTTMAGKAQKTLSDELDVLLRSLDPDALTAREALNLLYEIKKVL